MATSYRLTPFFVSCLLALICFSELCFCRSTAAVGWSSTNATCDGISDAEKREGETIIFDIDPLSNPYYFAVEIRTKFTLCEFYDQGVDLADASSSNQNNWKPMRYTPSMVSSWALDSGGLPLRAPFSIRLTNGPSQIQVAKNIIPVGWRPGASYPSSLLCH
ncbi:hypothetical protein RHSIM_Rhsim03G0164100 [Rhododendron simsii]|uniref:Expansin-like CBD domain-containing protein n=1 Tax=Rhododendron simsii TaxID=118357 RepID=A0A834H645_RHOSS|nr:hypothetical protein RHSIM_Rhsim03G0164100 [Rhododendron simsii]